MVACRLQFTASTFCSVYVFYMMSAKCPQPMLMVARSVDSCRSALSQIAAGRREFTPSKIPASRMTQKFLLLPLKQFRNAKLKGAWTGYSEVHEIGEAYARNDM